MDHKRTYQPMSNSIGNLVTLHLPEAAHQSIGTMNGSTRGCVLNMAGRSKIDEHSFVK